MWRAAAGLAHRAVGALLRHSYVSHLIEDGVDPLFVQSQVGHSWASTTAVCTTVGADAKNRMLAEGAGPRLRRRPGWRDGAVSTAVGYHWHLRRVMAGHGMFQTSDLVPLLAERGVKLSREQVYRLVAGVPQRLSLATLAALCDILDCAPGDLVEPYRAQRAPPARQVGHDDPPPRPKRARVAPPGGNSG